MVHKFAHRWSLTGPAGGRGLRRLTSWPHLPLGGWPATMYKIATSHSGHSGCLAFIYIDMQLFKLIMKIFFCSDYYTFAFRHKNKYNFKCISESEMHLKLY